jgi:hypothetical protein
MGRSAIRASLLHACILGVLLMLATPLLTAARANTPFDAVKLAQTTSSSVSDRTDVDRASLAAANGARADAAEQRRIIIGSAVSFLIFLLVCGFAFWRASREQRRPDIETSSWDGHAN